MDMQDIKDNWLKYLVIIVVVILLILAVILATLQEPTVKSAQAELKGLSPTYVDLKVTLRVENPNILGGVLKDLKADVYKGSSYVGPAWTSDEFDVPAMETSTIVVTLRVVEPLNTAAPGSWGAVGTATVEVWGQTFDLPFDTR